MPLWSHAVYFLDVLAFGSVCGGDTPPVQPPVPQSPPKTSKKLRIEVVNPSGQPIVGAAVTILGQHPYEAWQVGGPTDAEGIYRFDTFGLGVTPVLVTVIAAGFVTWSELMPIPANDDWSYRRTLEAVPVPVYPFASESGSLIMRDGLMLRDTGAGFDWRGWSGFLWFARFLRGENIHPQIEQALECGANVVTNFERVHAADGWPGWEDFEHPEQRPDYVDQFHAFHDLVNREYGLRIQHVPITGRWDALSVQRQQTQQLYDLLTAWPMNLVCVCNEPAVNSTHPDAILDGLNRRGILTASGDYFPVPPPDATASTLRCDASAPDFQPDARSTFANRQYDYAEFHSDRSRFPRSEKDGLEYRDGGVSCPPIARNGLYWTSREPMKAAAPGSPATQYSSESRDFQTAAGIARMYCGGFELHSENGRYGRLLDATEVACAKAVLSVYQFLPALHGQWTYTRGGFADFPIIWQDSDSAMQHCYGAVSGLDAYVVLIQPTLPAPFYRGPSAGWTVVKQDGNLLHLRRV